MDSNSTNNKQAPYDQLKPETILDAIDATGHICSGSLLALNSYENRVYQVGLEEGGFIIAKFYRPGRWSDESIREEHAYALELAGLEIPMVAPLINNGANEAGETLLSYEGFRMALFPRRGGRWPELDVPDNLRWLGRFIGRIHACGANRPFEHRPRLTPQNFGTESYQYLLEKGFVPREMEHNYRVAAEQIMDIVNNLYDSLGPFRQIRLHGDCHPGNILWTDNGPHFVDLDDCRMGPPIQDLWMLLSGERDEMTQQFRHLLEGYEEFFELDLLELNLIEALRSLRLLHYSAWLARRWDDPAFPMHFPWFNTPRYWEEQLYTLREQAERLDAPTLSLS